MWSEIAVDGHARGDGTDLHEVMDGRTRGEERRHVELPVEPDLRGLRRTGGTFSRSVRSVGNKVAVDMTWPHVHPLFFTVELAFQPHPKSIIQCTLYALTLDLLTSTTPNLPPRT